MEWKTASAFTLPATFAVSLKRSTTIPIHFLVDIEGSELLLLDPHYIPSLRHATLIVETHDCFLPGTGQRLIERFQPTHAIERVDTHKRTPSDFPLPLPSLPFDPSQYTLSYMDEQRPSGMYWLILRPIP